MNEETAYEQQCYYLYQVGADVSRHFGTDGAEVSPVPICLTDSSALVPKCLGSEVSRVRSVCTPT